MSKQESTSGVTGVAPLSEMGEHIAPPVKHRALKRFCKNKGAVVGVICVAIITFACTFPSLFTKYQQNNIDLLSARLSPSTAHWFGTDNLGRDQFTEVLHAGLVSIKIAFMVAIFSTLIGATVGALAGFRMGYIDSFLMRTTDLILCVPQLIILAIALHKFGGGGPFTISAIITIVFWAPTARYVRGQALSLRTREYVDAARVSGRGTFYIVFRHIIPNSWSIIAVSSAFSVALAIQLETTLSFLGFGVQPPHKSLGLLLDAATGQLSSHFNLFLAPGLTIFVIVLSFFFIGDGLRDALDPRSEQT